MPKNVAPNSGEPPIGFWNRRQPAPIMANHSRRCSAANTIPKSIVTPSQRTPADVRPDCAVATAATMVRLLVSRQQVLVMPFTMVGEKADGDVECGLARLWSHE